MEDISTPAMELPPAEDDSLDDFFAKKDKGKKGKKKKTKYITTEALAKTLEKLSTGVEEEEQKLTKKEKEISDGAKGVNNNDGEEWHEFEDESERDYSDLKIQNFQISEQQEPEPEPQYNEEGELILPKEAEGPWKSVTKESSSSPAPEPAPVRKPDPTPEPATTKSVYRPPHARLTPSSAGTPSTGGSIPPGMGRRRRPQEAPVINSEIDFPSLASAVQDTEQHVGFETVKSGAKSISRSQQQQQQNASQATGLTLGNQFEALRD